MPNSFSFCLFVKLVTSPSTLNEAFPSKIFLLVRFSLPSLTNIACQSLLACRVFDEKAADSLMGAPLYITCCFFLAAFNTLSLIFPILSTICGLLWVNPVWDSLCFLDLDVSFPKSMKFSAINSLYKVLCPFLSLFCFWNVYTENISMLYIFSEVF